MADYSQYASLLGSIGGGKGSGAAGDVSSSTSASSINFGGSDNPWLVPGILGAVVLLVALVLISKT